MGHNIMYKKKNDDIILEKRNILTFSRHCKSNHYTGPFLASLWSIVRCCLQHAYEGNTLQSVDRGNMYSVVTRMK